MRRSLRDSIVGFSLLGGILIFTSFSLIKSSVKLSELVFPISKIWDLRNSKNWFLELITLLIKKSLLFKTNTKLIGWIKVIIKKNIEKLFKVNVIKVNIINQKAKSKIKQGKKSIKSGYKKAIVTLKKGQSIDLTTGI